jgi:hypothetical protein
MLGMLRQGHDFEMSGTSGAVVTYRNRCLASHSGDVAMLRRLIVALATAGLVTSGCSGNAGRGGGRGAR